MAIHEYAFLGKDYVKFEDAKISVMTHAFMYGTAVFEGIRAYWNDKEQKLYALHVREHLERIVRSCKIMRIDPYYSVDEMVDIVIGLLKRNAPKQDCYIRPSWFKSSLRIGPNLVAGIPGAKANDAHNPAVDDDDSFVVTTLDLGNYVSTDKGLSVQVSAWRRVSDNAIPARAKVNGAYVNTALAKSDAYIKGFDEAIFLTEEGHVSEGSAMNLFIIRDGKLITSGVTENILEGITRQTIIKIAKEELGIETEVRTIDRTELYIADEAFFCGTGAQVAPISKIDNYELGNGGIGPIAKKLQALYFDICYGRNSKYKDMLTEIDYAKSAA